MAKRRHDTGAETEVLRKSGRRCCICYGLHRDLNVKKGQIAHLDQNAVNTVVENLAFLCLEHHDEYDALTRQSKGFTIQEVKAYRADLYKAIEAFRVMIDSNMHIAAIDGVNRSINEFLSHLSEIARSVDRLTYVSQRIEARLRDLPRSWDKPGRRSTR